MNRCMEWMELKIQDLLLLLPKQSEMLKSLSAFTKTEKNTNVYFIEP